MLNIPVADLTAPGVEAPVAARDAWLACRVLPWEIRQRVRLEPLVETVQRLPAAVAYVGGDDAVRIFFAMLAAAYAAQGTALPRIAAAEYAAEVAAIDRAVRAEIEAVRNVTIVETVQCMFTGETMALLGDGRVALRLGAG